MNPFRKIRLFTRETLGELKKTSWPDRKELKQSTAVVLVGAVLLGGFVGIVDFSLFQVVTLLIDFVR